MYTVIQNHPGCSGGWAVVDDEGKMDGCFMDQALAEAYAKKENLEEEYEDKIEILERMKDALEQEKEMAEDMLEQKSVWSGAFTDVSLMFNKRDYGTGARERMAGSGQAMPDGSFPIANRADLRNAIQSVGRAKNYEAARRHIIRRARALGATDMLPEDWK